MLHSKHIEKICGVLVLFCFAIAFVFMNSESFGITSAESNNYEAHFFSELDVHTIDIIVDETAWQNLLDTASDKEYIVCDLLINGERFSNIAIRAKGNSSLQQVQSSDSDRYSFKIEFDHYDKTKTYYGLDKLALNNIIQDNTFMKDYMAYTLMSDFGVASPLVNYTNVSVNGEAFGLYLAVETIEESFLQRNYGNSYGIAYKPETTGGGGGAGGGGGGDMPMGDMPMGDMPMGDMPMGDMPMGDMPMSDMPMGEIPMDNVLMGNMPMGEIPMGNMPMSDMPMGDMPMGDMPMGNMPMGDMPMGEMPMGDMPMGNMPMSDMPMGDMPMGNMPMSDMPMGEIPMDNMPMDHMPMDHMPMGDTMNQGQGRGEMPVAESETLTEATAGRTQSDRQAGGMGGGSLSSCLEYSGDDASSYSYIFDNAAIDISNSDKTRLIASLKQLNEQVDLEEVIDIEAVMRYFIVHSFLLNYDSYTGGIMHNYYIYEHHGVISMLPWDYNLSFVSFMTSYSTEELINFPMDTPVSSSTVEARPMLAWIFADETYTKMYHELYQEFITDFFDSGYFSDMVDNVQATISEAVEADPSKFCTYDAYLIGLDTLREVVDLRIESLQGQLDGTIPSTAEAQAEDDTRIDVGSLDITLTGSERSSGGGGGGDRGGMQQGERTEADTMNQQAQGGMEQGQMGMQQGERTEADTMNQQAQGGMEQGQMGMQQGERTEADAMNQQAQGGMQQGQMGMQQGERTEADTMNQQAQGGMQQGQMGMAQGERTEADAMNQQAQGGMEQGQMGRDQMQQGGMQQGGMQQGRGNGSSGMSSQQSTDAYLWIGISAVIALLAIGIVYRYQRRK